MRPDLGHSKQSSRKRDLFTAAAVVVYLAIVGGAVEAWSFLSQKADAFAAARVRDR